MINAVTAPLREIERLWRMDYQSSAGEYEQQKEEAELRRRAWKQQYVARKKAGKKRRFAQILPLRRRFAHV